MTRVAVAVVLSAACAHRGVRASPAAPLDLQAIEERSGVEAVVSDGGVARIVWPRGDVPVSIDGTRLSVLPLDSWAALSPAPGGALLLGEAALFEDEVTAALDTALAVGLEVHGLHHRFLYERPRIVFMRLAGRGNAPYLAGAVAEVWAAARAVRKARPDPAERTGEPGPQPGWIDAERVSEVLGVPAESSRGLVRVSIGRRGRVKGLRVGASMGLATRATFHGSDARAVVDGSLVLAAGEVQRVLRALRSHNLRIGSLHSHLTAEVPAYTFVHFRGTGRVQDLALALRAALDARDGAL